MLPMRNYSSPRVSSSPKASDSAGGTIHTSIFAFRPYVPPGIVSKPPEDLVDAGVRVSGSRI